MNIPHDLLDFRMEVNRMHVTHWLLGISFQGSGGGLFGASTGSVVSAAADSEGAA